MASVNKVIIVGNLGADPETRYTQGGDAIANFSVATTESWKDKSTGEKKELTEWHRCSVFGKLAEICGQYLKKGSQVYIEGKLQTRKWQDKEGIDRYTTEIKIDEMRMLGGRPEGAGSGNQQSAPRQDSGRPAQGGKNDGRPNFTDDDSIPF